MGGAIMDVQKLAADLIPLVGGKENIQNVLHCMTRLRFQLANQSKAQLEAIEQLDGVMGVKVVGAQTQVIIGPNVAEVFKEVTKLTGELQGAGSPEPQKPEKQKLSARVLDMISGIFAPVIPLITGAGMIKAILTILVLFGLSDTSSEYYILNFIADSGFYFFPVVLAFSSAKKFGCNPYLAAMIGGVLIHPSWNALVSAGEAVSFFGIPVQLYSYGSSILPTILTVWFMSFVERFADRVSPNMVKAILKPLITMAVTSLVSLLLLAPLGTAIGSVLSGVIGFLDRNVPALVPTIVGAVQPFLVFFGMHLAIFPPLQTIQLAEMGYETVCGPGFLAAVLACSGATIGFGLRTKDPTSKELAFSTGFTAFCGVTEPAVYGIIIKYKQIIPAVMLGGICGGLFAGVFHLKRYALATPGVPALPTFIGEDPNNIFVAIGTVCIAFVVSLVAAYLLSGEKKSSGRTASKVQGHDAIPAVASEPNTLYAPLSGTAIPLHEVPDETFSAGILGQGMAILPADSTVYAPFDGSVIQTVDSKHAVGLCSADGMEVLIHVGIDTVDMNGQGFTLLCAEGDTVKRGQPLLTFEPETIQSAGHPTVTVIIVTNSDDYKAVNPLKTGTVAAMDPILTVEA
jgi:PTS system beta-glucosides-specific IIC component